MKQLPAIFRFFALLLLFVLFSINISAKQKSDSKQPRWITSSLPSPKSNTYDFFSASGSGKTLEEARQHALINMSSKLETERGITINSSTTMKNVSESTDGHKSNYSSSSFQLECIENGHPITLNSRIIDEYWEQDADGYICYNLYAVSDKNNPKGSYDDDITLTTSYGAKGLAYSLIPGVGQIYKGSPVKGGIIIGGEIACATMIVVSENLRSSYKKKMIEKPEFLDYYNKKADDWTTMRNVFIGAAAAIYVYNLIDAAVAPGRRQVVVKKNKSKLNYTFIPAFSNNYAGLSLVMNF